MAARYSASARARMIATGSAEDASGAVERRVVGIGNGRWAGAACRKASEPLPKDVRPPSLLQGPSAPARLEPPPALEVAAAHTVDEVVQMHGHAYVVGNDLHHVPHARPPPARAKIEHAMLL